MLAAYSRSHLMVNVARLGARSDDLMRHLSPPLHVESVGAIEHEWLVVRLVESTMARSIASSKPPGAFRRVEVGQLRPRCGKQAPIMVEPIDRPKAVSLDCRKNGQNSSRTRQDPHRSADKMVQRPPKNEPLLYLRFQNRSPMNKGKPVVSGLRHPRSGICCTRAIATRAIATTRQARTSTTPRRDAAFHSQHQPCASDSPRQQPGPPP